MKIVTMRMNASISSRTEKLGRGLHRAARGRGGYTFIEMMAVMVIIGALSTIAIPRIHDALDKAKVARATGDISSLQSEIEGFRSVRDSLPPSLASIGRGGMLDPWGNPYQYMPTSYRTDQFSMPLNTSYDVYSVGKNGTSSQSLSGASSQDDVVRAADGGFVGLGKKY
jgi:general secretion pathway protein G